MKRIAVACVSLALCSSCTLGGAAAGALTAVTRNHYGDDDHASAAKYALVGAGIGLVVDLYVFTAIGRGLGQSAPARGQRRSRTGSRTARTATGRRSERTR